MRLQTHRASDVPCALAFSLGPKMDRGRGWMMGSSVRSPQHHLSDWIRLCRWTYVVQDRCQCQFSLLMRSLNASITKAAFLIDSWIVAKVFGLKTQPSQSIPIAGRRSFWQNWCRCRRIWWINRPAFCSMCQRSAYYALLRQSLLSSWFRICRTISSLSMRCVGWISHSRTSSAAIGQSFWSTQIPMTCLANRNPNCLMPYVAMPTKAARLLGFCFGHFFPRGIASEP